MTKCAFLGPAGTFTEEALLSLEIPGVEPVPCATIGDVLAAASDGRAEYGVVPIENSVEGSVNATLDALAFDTELYIQRELVRDINHALIVAPGVTMEDVTAVVSHPQATAQCRCWLAEHLPGRPILAANSTAEAATRAVAEPGLAAVGTALAAELNGGVVLHASIEDFEGNQTRFIVLGKELQKRTGHDKTSLALFMHEDKPGALLMILSEFAFGQISLTKIQSRPTKRALGEYMFYVDLEGHVEDDAVALALECLRLKLRSVKLLGSYPNSR
ncbi:MAG: prephenate dehydratase [Coriobacteriia bacterium]|nr:prephenate dehydratase [Coriobacteriia bacterium]